MLQKISLLALFLALLVQAALAQDGKVSGTVRDEKGNPIGSATILLLQGSTFRYGANSAADGTFSIQPVQPGTYTINAKYLTTVITIPDVEVIAGQTKVVPIKITTEEAVLTTDEVVITETLEQPAFSTDPAQVNSLSGSDYKNMGSRNINTMAATTPGVYAADDGGAISVRGARESATTTYIDGVKVRGNANLPQAAIKQMQIYVGGTPAEFGDFTGGVMSLTTSSPESQMTGGGEFMTSRFTDPYNKNLFAANVSGPLLRKKDSAYGGEITRSVLGYFLSGEYDFSGDQDPAIQGVYRLKGDGLSNLEQNPVRIAPDGRAFRANALYLRNDAWEEIKAKQQNQDLRIRALGRIDFEPVRGLQFKLGGNMELINSDSYSNGRSLLSPNNQDLFRGAQYRAWARIQQSFQGDSSDLIRNLFYTLQGDYSMYYRNFVNRYHDTDLFNYGYIGKFDYDIAPFYGYFNDPTGVGGITSSPYWRTVAYGSQNLRFSDAGTGNQTLANYNNYIFNYIQNNGIVNPARSIFSPFSTVYSLSDMNSLAFVQGLRNGDGPTTAYNLFSGVGSQTAFYQKYAFEQFRLSGQATAEIKNHNLKIGFEFEQRIERSYVLNAAGLWNRMRLLANQHLQSLATDPNSFRMVYVDDQGSRHTFTQAEAENWLSQNTGRQLQFQDTVQVPFDYDPKNMGFFAKEIRNKMGLKGNDWVNTDAITPSFYTDNGGLDLFSAEELNGPDGNGPLGGSYQGYTYKGQKMNRRADPYSFFTDSTNRPQNAFAPTYISAFLQDKFEFKDIDFNGGVRVDYFDANQPVLKDPYLLYDAYNAKETADLLKQTKPGAVSDSWVAYVDNPEKPTKVIGYRDGDVWYDATGTPTEVSRIIEQSNGTVKPFNKTTEVGKASFTDYKPQVVVMPRLAFSFPLNDKAEFFAHYDVLAQRPGQVSQAGASLLAGQISDYYYLKYRTTTNDPINNPNLRPEITVDYEAGFKQALDEDKRLGLTISAFYREMRNMVRYRRYTSAYPYSYDTYANLDFGTAKGLTVDFKMNRTKNLSLKLGYTLQFVQTTGSSFNSARNVTQNLRGVGILRTSLADDRDQRHRIVGIIDYRFVDNPGPALHIGEKTYHPLSQFGVNLNMRMGSGTPYTQNALPLTLQSGVSQLSQTLGVPNGARKPATFAADLRVDKGFTLGGKKKEDGGKTHEYTFNVYLLALNVFNSANVVGIYRYTGSASDDGYLQSAIGQQAIISQADPQSFIDLYTARMRNPDNFSSPRRLRLGVEFNF